MKILQNIDTKKLATITAGICYAALIVSMATATFMEASHGSEFAANAVYHSPWFIALWALCCIAALYLCIILKGRRKLETMLPHIALALILLGAATTFFTGQKGIVHLRQGEPADSFLLEGKSSRGFDGFSLVLDSFRVITHPGTSSPADYESRITAVHSDGRCESLTVSMNNIAVVNHYRLYQTSFDQDLHGSYLSVNRDPVGISITYTGYCLLFASFALLLLSPRGRFRNLLRKLNSTQGKALVAAVVLLVPSLAEATPIIPKAQADSLKYRPVLYNGRIAPFNTVATDFVKKLYGKATYNGLSAEQVLGSCIAYPVEWSAEKLLKIKDAGLQKALGIDGKFASWQDLYDGRLYKLTPYLDKDGKSEFAKAAHELDDKNTLLLMLQSQSLFNPVLDKEALDSVNPTKLRAEVLYNSLPLAGILFKINMALGLAAFLFTLCSLFFATRLQFANKTLWIWNIVSFLLILSHQILRGYVSGHVPLSGGYECMVSVAGFANLAGIAAGRREPILSGSAILVSGATLMVASFSSSNPSISLLMPVLDSPWLSAHVSCMVISYALAALTAINALAGLVAVAAKNHAVSSRIALLNNAILYPTVGFMATGIFLGAIWANVSWGRYWAWDPKETWALISLMLYALPLHNWFQTMFKNKFGLHLYYVLCILAIAMTYFGVNKLGGMHSY